MLILGPPAISSYRLYARKKGMLMEPGARQLQAGREGANPAGSRQDRWQDGQKGHMLTAQPGRGHGPDRPPAGHFSPGEGAIPAERAEQCAVPAFVPLPAHPCIQRRSLRTERRTG
jgi:hypothetical protein